jgi:general transcription factor 3C polypeptide 3 (transcription factor C subunit 4)
MPTFEIQGLLGQANQLYVNGELDQAQAILQEIIRVDYNVFAAWQTLGEVHKDKGNIEKCLTAWMTAAHLRPKDTELWSAVASLSVQCGLVEQADYCYHKLSRARPQDVDILWDRALLNRDHGHNKKVSRYRTIVSGGDADPYRLLKSIARF